GWMGVGEHPRCKQFVECHREPLLRWNSVAQCVGALEQPVGITVSRRAGGGTGGGAPNEQRSLEQLEGDVLIRRGLCLDVVPPGEERIDPRDNSVAVPAAF